VASALLADPRARAAPALALALDEAIRVDASELIELLLEAGAELERADARGRTPLLQAAALGRGETVRALLARGSNPAARSRSGQTALHLAARSGDLSGVEALLGAGADAVARDARGRTALREASTLEPARRRRRSAAGRDARERSVDPSRCSSTRARHGDRAPSRRSTPAS
jgi:hypothetical protein